jgi:cell division septation protein DedD
LSGKRYKSRGFVISFGDIMLPLIGLVAIGLLLLAGRLFFTSNFHSDRASLPVIAPTRQEKKEKKPAQTQERAAAPASSAPPVSNIPPEKNFSASPAARAVETAPVLAVPDVLAIPHEEKKISVSPERRTPVFSPKVEERTASSAGSAKTQPKPRPVLPPKPAVKVAVSNPAAKKTAPASSPNSPNSSNSSKTPDSSAWMVQVGAFSMKSAADGVARQLSQDGHSVKVVSGKTIHRVLIMAKDKNDASALATRMDRSGFIGAFVISPKQ